MLALDALLNAAMASAAATPWRFVGYDHEVWPQKPKDLSTPLGIRLGVGSPTSMNVGWSTFEKPSELCVSYGTSSKQLNQTACANGSTIYETSRLWFTHVELSGLKPATQYYYKIYSSNSSTETFTSALLPGDKTPFSFAVAADMGLYGPDGYEVQQAQQAANDSNLMDPKDYHISADRLSIMADEDNVHLVVHPGDFAYADQSTENYNDVAHGGIAVYEALLEQFYTQLSQISRKAPYMVGPGNHEVACKEVSLTDKFCPKGQNNFTDYIYRHQGVMPTGFASTSKNDTARELRAKANNMSVAPMWYSFDYGSVHFVMINTETDFLNAPDQTGSIGPDSYNFIEGPFGRAHQQVEWLEADLASVDRTVTPWVVVNGHRPWYTSNRTKWGCHSCQDAFEDIMYKNSVDLAIFGHVHNSQRYLPMYQGVPDTRGYNNPLAPTYLVAGAAGNIEGFSPIDTDPTLKVGMQWSSDEYYTVVRVDVESEEDMKVTYIRSSDGKELDSFNLHREHNEQFMTNMM